MLCPKTNKLTASQRDFVTQFTSIKSHPFVLYGDAAFCLRLGHRNIESFAFYTNDNFTPTTILQELTYFKDLEIIHQNNNILSCQIKGPEMVRMEFYGGLKQDRIYNPEKLSGINFKVASLLDLTATWMKAVQIRDHIPFYQDIHASLQANVTLQNSLAAAKAIYRSRFIPHISLNCMTYFLEDDISLPLKMKHDLLSAIQTVNTSELPYLIAQYHLEKDFYATL